MDLPHSQITQISFHLFRPQCSSTTSLNKKESSAQTDDFGSSGNEESSSSSSKEIATQTMTQWLQISLSSPPLALTQEVPDVAL